MGNEKKSENELLAKIFLGKDGIYEIKKLYLCGR